MSAPTDQPPRRSRRGALWAASAVLIVAVVLAVLYATGVFTDQPTDDKTHGPSGPAVHTDENSQSMELPGEERVASVEFGADSGSTAVVTFDTDATLDSSLGDQRAAYTVTGVSCASVDDEDGSTSQTGTENLENEQSRELTVRLVYQVQTSGTQRCNATVRVPNWDAGGGARASMDLDSTLSVDQDPSAVQAAVQPEAQEPIIVGRDDKDIVIDQTLDIPASDSDLQVSATSHVTTCTIENGSKDQTDQNLCTPDILDERGSTVTVHSYADVLSDGKMCERVEIQDEKVHIDNTVHHKLLGTAPDSVGELKNPCGDQIRLVQTVENSGPAPVVVHRKSSNMVLTATS